MIPADAAGFVFDQSAPAPVLETGHTQALRLSLEGVTKPFKQKSMGWQ